MPLQSEIFFSYAWSDVNELGSNREKIVNELYEALIADGYNVIRDKKDLRYKELISDLTGRIGRGKFIIVAISDKYLKSTYCMSELLEIYRRSNSDIGEMLKKIFPIVLEDAKIYNPEDRVEYLKFWEAKKEELNEELKGIGLEHAATFAEDLRMYDEITSVIPVLSTLLKDINTLNPKKLSANNFEEIKNAIIKTVLPAPTLLPRERGGLRFAKSFYVPALIVTLATIILVVCFLYFGHVSTTKVRLELTLSEVSFRLSQQQVLTNIMKLSSIGALGLEKVQLPAGRLAENGFDGSGSAVLLSLDTGNNHSGSLTLDALPLPNGIRIGIRQTDLEGEYRFSFQGKEVKLPVQVNGPVKMALPPNAPKVLNFTSPAVIYLQSGKEGVDLDLNFLSGLNKVFPEMISADSISLLRIDENFDNESSIVRTVSTVLSGTIYFESTGKPKQLLLRGQHVQFQQSQGQISTLELLNNHINFTFTGSVSGMTTGDNNNRINLMPTYLEWLKARVGLPLLFGVVLLIFVLIFAALHRRRSRV